MHNYGSEGIGASSVQRFRRRQKDMLAMKKIKKTITLLIIRLTDRHFGKIMARCTTQGSERTFLENLSLIRSVVQEEKAGQACLIKLRQTNEQTNRRTDRKRLEELQRTPASLCSNLLGKDELIGRHNTILNKVKHNNHTFKHTSGFTTFKLQ